ncbi:hypothetical protein [Geobacillus thermodenitrificans]|jgi:hypothetical protein|uniref:Uncharacterized protein n=1 Tax=Geobacillus thermodenitrificans (strain NG80-2) TaxID=420246 RepID=A4INL6_GEOTN|nr:hypothetical protein [Geobacillus thermodenitrificans]ABO66920.1 Conserved hypothetical protein [Geobacillus thermodenitrificans NG80-2]MED0661725.1 hypothetical protein [Geobacillus thermodenitrificans]PJW20703.1 hypothetical protein CV632_09280 [Geobacillus thermodenitrificans]
MVSRLPEIENKIHAIEKELYIVKQALKEIKNLRQQNKLDGIQAICYFTYSLLLPNTKGNKATVAANFVIRNMGSIPLDNPFICLRVTPKERIALSAKLGDEIQYDQRINPLVMEPWNYMSEQAEQMVEEKGEFWLKPVRVSRIEPGQTLSFSNFQFHLEMGEERMTYKMEGFFFCRQFQEGVRALNHIIIHS